MLNNLQRKWKTPEARLKYNLFKIQILKKKKSFDIAEARMLRIADEIKTLNQLLEQHEKEMRIQ